MADAPLTPEQPPLPEVRTEEAGSFHHRRDVVLWSVADEWAQAYGDACYAAGLAGGRAAPPSPPVAAPAGWQFVPIEPDAHMTEAPGIDVGPNTARKTWAGMIAAAPQPPRPGTAPLSDERLKKLSATGPVHCENGVVTRSPFAYREELQARFEKGFRAAEKHHGIGHPTTPTPKDPE